ncbi:hypothetical protein [Saccharothrix syringae]|uniref:hypothetical protein n=1 Tax=Saccharothrix syringae TaxID=103733 RepID=UPI0007C492BF|nr:hypothetical protein [Saccharothrix syringae]
MTAALTTPEEASDATRITALLAELRATGDAVGGREWLSDELAGEPAAPLGSLGSTERPLSALDGAGLGFLTPMISFLEEPLDQLRGDPGAVSAGAGEFDSAARDATAVAAEYRSTAGAETDGWSGRASSDYLRKGTELADGVLSVAETSLTAAKALVGAGEVVAQVVEVVTGLVAKAVGQIGPIMTKAIAEAPATFGQSIALAIPECVRIAVECGVEIAGKLAALLASGENLIKLVEGALGVLKVVKEVMSFIGEQSQGGKPADPGTAPATAPAAPTAAPTPTTQPTTAPSSAPATQPTTAPSPTTATQPTPTPSPSPAPTTTTSPTTTPSRTPEEPA